MEQFSLPGFGVGGVQWICFPDQALSERDIAIRDKVKFPIAELGTRRQGLMRMAGIEIRHGSRYGFPHPRLRGCGAPLDPRRGMIRFSPNLPDWENIPTMERSITEEARFSSFACRRRLVSAAIGTGIPEYAALTVGEC